MGGDEPASNINLVRRAKSFPIMECIRRQCYCAMLLPAFDCGEGQRAAAAAAAAALGQNGWYICGSGSAYERRAEGRSTKATAKKATVQGGAVLGKLKGQHAAVVF